MAAVRDALIDETDHPRGRLARRPRRRGDPRAQRAARPAGRLGHPGARESRGGSGPAELKRLLTDISHHFQRLHDLAYDEVELELGGSE